MIIEDELPKLVSYSARCPNCDCALILRKFEHRVDSPILEKFKVPDKLKKRNLFETSLSNRVKKALNCEGHIGVMGDLDGKTILDLYRLKGFGRHSLHELNFYLKENT